ncbi:GP88 family protein [Stieleria maiorica]
MAKTLVDTATGRPYLSAGVTLAPHNLSGHNVCAGASKGCAASCVLWFAGLRGTSTSRNAATRDTQWLFGHRRSFINQLNRDIANHVRRAERDQFVPVVRLNVASDLDWTDVIERWPGVQFYDYTKIRSRFASYLAGELPPNYALTFSRHERHHTATIASYLRRGGNVAQVFDVEYNPQCGRVGGAPRNGPHSWPTMAGDRWGQARHSSTVDRRPRRCCWFTLKG